MAVVSYGLHIEQESHQETDQYGKELDGKRELASVSEDEKRLSILAATCHQHGNERTEHNGRRGQKGRCHYVVSQCLHRKNTILWRILHFMHAQKQIG